MIAILREWIAAIRFAGNRSEPYGLLDDDDNDQETIT